MKKLNKFINEKLKISSKMYRAYTCQPKSARQLHDIIEERLNSDKDADLNDIDVSKIQKFTWGHNYGLFKNLDPHNIKLDFWDMSNAIDINSMFDGCRNFDADLSNWDVSNVEDMFSVFYNCHNFEGKGLKYWNVGKCKDFSYMFGECYKFDENLGNWKLGENISGHLDIEYMFDNCKIFTGQGLEKWDFDADIKSLEGLFNGCKEFNPIDVSKWKFTNVKNMLRTFRDCEKFTFNGAENWKLNKIEYLPSAFINCKCLTNIDVGKWNITNKIKKLNRTFKDCINFEGNGLDKWDVNPHIAHIDDIFDNCPSLKNKPDWSNEILV